VLAKSLLGHFHIHHCHRCAQGVWDVARKHPPLSRRV
jgi:hypothetical protein